MQSGVNIEDMSNEICCIMRIIKNKMSQIRQRFRSSSHGFQLSKKYSLPSTKLNQSKSFMA